MSNNDLGGFEECNLTDKLVPLDDRSVEREFEGSDDKKATHVSSTEIHLEVPVGECESDHSSNDLCTRDQDSQNVSIECRSGVDPVVSTVPVNTIPKTVYTPSPPRPILASTTDFNSHVQVFNEYTGGAVRSPGIVLSNSPPLQDVILTSVVVDRNGPGGGGSGSSDNESGGG